MRVRRDQRLWVFGFAGIVTIHLVWKWFDSQPPAWDMAHHQMMGFAYRDAVARGSFSRLPVLTQYYPPLYYLVEAAWFSIAGWSFCWPVLSNLFGLFLVSFCTYRLGMRYLRPTVAACSGLIVLLLPLVAWTSREALLDVTLTGFVVLTLYLLRRSHYLTKTIWVWPLALAIAGGSLTKWTYPVFIVGPLAYVVLRAGDRALALKNLLNLVLLALPPVFLWYLPNLNRLIERFYLTSGAAVQEQDPAWYQPLGLLYYPRSFASYYLFLPLTLAAVFSAVVVIRRGELRRLPRLLWLTLFGGLLLLTLMSAKDPRYVMPLVPFLVLLILYPWRRSKRAAYWVLAGAFLQFLLISFPGPLAATRLAIGVNPEDRDYLDLNREWVWFETHYYDVFGPPKRHDWHYEDILDHLKPGATIGFVPELVRFHNGALEWYAARRSWKVRTRRLGAESVKREELAALEWIVGKSGAQGISYLTRHNDEVYTFLETLQWPLVASWPLPDGSEARLWRNPTRSR